MSLNYCLLNRALGERAFIEEQRQCALQPTLVHAGLDF